MTSPDAALAARPATCSACNGSLDALGRCVLCGAVFGDAYRCPLCHAISDIEPDSTLYFRCRTCGGPRLPPSSQLISAAEAALLRTARSEQLRAGAFRAGSGFALGSGLLSVFITSVVLLVTAPAASAKFAALLASVVPFVLALFAFRRAREHARKLREALHKVWLSAASRLARQHGGRISAQTLSEELRIDEARAELLLAEASVQDFLREPAELPAHLRVTDLAEPGDLGAAQAARDRVASGKS